MQNKHNNFEQKINKALKLYETHLDKLHIIICCFIVLNSQNL